MSGAFSDAKLPDLAKTKVTTTSRHRQFRLPETGVPQTHPQPVPARQYKMAAELTSIARRPRSRRNSQFFDLALGRNRGKGISGSTCARDSPDQGHHLDIEQLTGSATRGAPLPSGWCPSVRRRHTLGTIELCEVRHAGDVCVHVPHFTFAPNDDSFDF